MKQLYYYQDEEGTYAPVWVAFKRHLHENRMAVNTFCKEYMYDYNYLRSKLIKLRLEKKVVDEIFTKAGLVFNQVVEIPDFKIETIDGGVNQEVIG